MSDRSSFEGDGGRRQLGSARTTAFVVAFIAAFVAAFVAVRSGAPDIAIPAIDTTTMQPTVARAITQARSQVAAAPRSEAAWRDFANVLDAHGLLDEAREAYDQVVALNPDDLRSRYHRALVFEYLGEPAASLEEYRALIAAGVDDAAIHFRLGELHVRDGRNEEARDAFRASLERDPASAIARRGLGNALLALGEVEEAVRVLEPLATSAANDRGSISALVQAYRRNGDVEKSKALAAQLPDENTLALDDPVRFQLTQLAVDSDALLARAREKEARRDYRGAIADLERAAEAAPDLAGVHDKIGRNYVILQLPQQAIPAFNRALAIDPSRTQSYYNRGVAHQRSGNRTAAVADFRRALTLDPDYVAAVDRLRELGERP